MLKRQLQQVMEQVACEKVAGLPEPLGVTRVSILAQLIQQWVSATGWGPCFFSGW